MFGTELHQGCMSQQLTGDRVDDGEAGELPGGAEAFQMTHMGIDIRKRAIPQVPPKLVSLRAM